MSTKKVLKKCDRKSQFAGIRTEHLNPRERYDLNVQVQLLS